MQIKQGRLSIACVCMIFGFMLAIQFRTTEDMKSTVSYQRVEELSEHLIKAEKERDDLKKELKKLKDEGKEASGNKNEEMYVKTGLTPVEGPGIIVRLDDSASISKAGENPNLYLIHDDDLLRTINELKAAGAEAISINGQRLVATSEIRCAGPTLSVNNVRSAPPYEIQAIGEKKSLENALKMRGGVAETLKVWGIQLEIKDSDDIYIPAYKGSLKADYAKVADDREEEK